MSADLWLDWPPLTPPACTHVLGTLPCDNDQPHPGAGKGCTHRSSWAPDKHTESEARDDD